MIAAGPIYVTESLCLSGTSGASAAFSWLSLLAHADAILKIGLFRLYFRTMFIYWLSPAFRAIFCIADSLLLLRQISLLTISFLISHAIKL